MRKSIISLIVRSVSLCIAIAGTDAVAVDVVIKGASTGDLGNDCTLNSLQVTSNAVTVILDDPNCINSGPADTTPPTISGLNPLDNGSSADLATNLVATFNENIKVGTGNVILYLSGGSVAETFNIATGTGSNGGLVSVSENALTIDPGTDLVDSSSYYVQIAATAIDDTSGNSYAGISDTTSWNFSVSTSGNVVVLTPSEFIPTGSSLPSTPENGMLPNTIYAMEFANVTLDHDIYLSLVTSSRAGFTDAYADVFLSYTPGEEGEVGTGPGCQYSNIMSKNVYIHSTWGSDDCDLDPQRGIYYINIRLSSHSQNNGCGVTTKCIKTGFPTGL
jgi:hypothetical protein